MSFMSFWYLRCSLWTYCTPFSSVSFVKNACLFCVHLGIKNIYLSFRCMYRVLDSFGTYVEFNFPSYPYDVPGNRSGWGNLNLIPTQFMTLYRKWRKKL